MISKRVYETAEGWLKKRDDLLEEERSALLNYIKLMKNVEALATARWFANEVIRVPEDQPKVNEAIKVAKRAKVDPLTYSSPMSILNTFKQYKIKEKAIDPDIVPELSNGRTVGLPSFSIRVYDVEDTKKGQLAMRKIINTHWGEDANPWCLLQGDGKGNLISDAWRYWNHYNGVPKRVAFKDGKLLAFCANDIREICWWDRQDVPYNGFRFVEKIKNDELRRSVFYELQENCGIVSRSLPFLGNMQNGEYKEWYENEQLKLRESYKSGKREGPSEEWYDNGQLKTRGDWKNGNENGIKESFYENGQMNSRCNYKGGLEEGLAETRYENGKLRARENYKDGKLEGLREERYKNGQIKERTNYKEGEKDGLHERFYDSGKLFSRESYKDGLKDGLSENWWENGRLKTQICYKEGREEGECKTWLKNGLLKSKWNSKNGWLDGLVENWWKNGNFADRANYKNGKLDGVQESWWENGYLESRKNFIQGKLDGLYEKWDRDGQLESRENYKDGQRHGLVETRNEDGSITRSIYNNGELQQEKSTKSFIKMGNEQRTIIAPRESKICMKV